MDQFTQQGGFDVFFRQEEQQHYGFNLALFCDNGEMKTLWLPQQPDGFYSFGDNPAEEAQYRFLSFEAKNGEWVAKCARPAFFQNVSPEQYYELPLSHNQLVTIEYEERLFYLYSEYSILESMIFHNYNIVPDARITIGRLGDNDICCGSRYITKYHAVLSRTGHKWHIEDCKSTNGVYVNGWRVRSADLNLGDVVYIMGVRILIGTGFISINDGNGRAAVSPRVIRYQDSHRSSYPYYSGLDTPQPQETFFNRKPRKWINLEDKIITVEAPPLSMDRAQTPLLLRMGGSMVMGGTAAMSGNFTMLLTSVLFPLLSNRYTEHQRKDYEQRRLTKYNAYLSQKQKEIDDACRDEHVILNRKYPEFDAVMRQAADLNPLWERRPNDDDFMSLRLGRGNRKMHTGLDYPTRTFELEPDDLEEKMYAMVEREYSVQNVPIMSDFTKDFVCGLLGQREMALNFTAQLVMQTAALHSYDEVKMVFLLRPEELEQLSFIRYLPHCWDDQKSIRFIATNEAEAYRLGEYIKDQLPEDLDKEQPLSRLLKHRPYYMVFALDKKIFDSMEILKTCLQSEFNHGLALLAVFDDLPKECLKIINLKPSGEHKITYLRQGGGEDGVFQMDPLMWERSCKAMKTISNLSMKAADQAYELPKMVTFLEMFQAGRIEHLNPLKRWRENNPVKSLAAPVGVGPDGSLFTLDLHEKRQGPHGLVAGMTGSGKSEFIITYILSMAVNYHPDEVAFILIDYKGGGLTGAFENPRTGVRLPHLVGTITNLDGAAIQRSLMSIQSELTRRQRIFNETKAATNEGTMDIYAYQKLYRAKKVSEPMPHLFIISDEFAELKQQQPEFMDKLISAARIGRSLGVHLILATQKPAGVVNDQIRSNTKFRVCLRVQDKTDSMDMLKRPEAAELTDTGRFYLQVGYNEFFALGQSAWCGAAYEPQDTVIVQKDDAVEFLDATGQVIVKNKPKIKKVDSGKKQLVATVDYLAELARQEGISPRMLWQEPLPKVLPMETLHQRYPAVQDRPIRAVMGIVDDPEHQDQYPMVQELQNCQHLMIVGDGGSGKSTYLQSMLYSLADNYTPEDVNFYILDFSNKLLAPFRRLPHCGTYMTEEDENNLARFFKFITDEVARRKKLIDEAGVNDYDSYLETRKLPLMLVVIDNLAAMAGTKPGSVINSTLHEYLRDCLSYGIKFVITASYPNEITARARQAIGTRVAFKAKDKFVYAEILGRKVTYVPADVTGRGLCVADGRPLEFQSMVVESEGTTLEQNNRLRQRLEVIARRNEGLEPALELPTLRDDEEYADFCRKFPKPGRIPLGYSVADIRPVAIPLKQLYSLSLYFGNPAGVAPVLKNLAAACRRENMEIIAFRRSRDSVLDAIPSGPDLTVLDPTAENSKYLWNRMISETQARRALRDEYCTDHGISIQAPDAMVLASDYIRGKTRGLMVIFESFRDFIKNADPDCEKVLPTVFAKGKGTNYYFTACFGPDEAEDLSMEPMMRQFNPDELAMFFGGQFNRQGLMTLPMEYRSVDKVSENYHRCVMHYQKKFHALQMPCGALVTDNENDDEASIF